jgi:aspartate kinase
VVGVASERDVLVVEAAESAGETLALLDAHGVAGKQLQQAADSLTLVVSRDNLHDEARVRDALAHSFADRVRIVDGLGAVSVVGAGINGSFQNLRRGSAALALAGIDAASVSTSSFRITWMVPRARMDDAVRLLHATFIGSAARG